MWRQPPRADVSELPLFRDRVQASRDYVEVGWPVITRARITLRCPGALKVDAGLTESCCLTKDILAFDRQGLPILITNQHISPAFNVEQLAVGYAGCAYEGLS